MWSAGEKHKEKVLAGDVSGWLHRYAHMDLSRGLGSDTSFEQSNTTSKTFK